MRHTLLCLLLLAPLAAHAEDVSWGLKWKAPDACIDAASLARAVEGRLGRHVFGITPQYRIDGVLEAGASPKWKAVLTVIDSGGGIAGSRDVTSNAADCHDLDQNLAFVIAVMIDPKAKPAGAAPGAVTDLAPPPPATDAPRARPIAKNEVLVHIDADKTNVRLLRYVGTSTGYTSKSTVVIHSFSDECLAPCDVVVPKASDRFYLDGDGMTPSEEFTLVDHQPAVDLKVTGGSAIQNWGGRTLVLLGFSGLLTGAILTPIAAASLGGQGRPFLENGLAVAGLISLGAGLVLGAIGIPLWLTSLTKLEFVDHGKAAPATPAMALR